METTDKTNYASPSVKFFVIEPKKMVCISGFFYDSEGTNDYSDGGNMDSQWF